MSSKNQNKFNRSLIFGKTAWSIMELWKKDDLQELVIENLSTETQVFEVISRSFNIIWKTQVRRKWPHFIDSSKIYSIKTSQVAFIIIVTMMFSKWLKVGWMNQITIAFFVEYWVKRMCQLSRILRFLWFNREV